MSAARAKTSNASSIASIGKMWGDQGRRGELPGGHHAQQGGQLEYVSTRPVVIVTFLIQQVFEVECRGLAVHPDVGHVAAGPHHARTRLEARLAPPPPR